MQLEEMKTFIKILISLIQIVGLEIGSIHMLYFNLVLESDHVGVSFLIKLICCYHINTIGRRFAEVEMKTLLAKVN